MACRLVFPKFVEKMYCAQLNSLISCCRISPRDDVVDGLYELKVHQGGVEKLFASFVEIQIQSKHRLRFVDFKCHLNVKITFTYTLAIETQESVPHLGTDSPISKAYTSELKRGALHLDILFPNYE